MSAPTSATVRWSAISRRRWTTGSSDSTPYSVAGEDPLAPYVLPLEVGMGMPRAAALHHTSFLVHDVEKTAQALYDSLGIGPWNVWTIEPVHCRVRGEDSPFTFRAALAQVGGGTFELVAPHTGRSVYDEHLERYGEGYHHTCLVYPSLQAVQEAKAELLRQGRQMILEASAGDVFDFAYFLVPEIGSPIEVLYLDAARLPPPERVIGAEVGVS